MSIPSFGHRLAAAAALALLAFGTPATAQILTGGYYRSNAFRSGAGRPGFGSPYTGAALIGNSSAARNLYLTNQLSNRRYTTPSRGYAPSPYVPTSPYAQGRLYQPLGPGAVRRRVYDPSIDRFGTAPYAAERYGTDRFGLRDDPADTYADTAYPRGRADLDTRGRRPGVEVFRTNSHGIGETGGDRTARYPRAADRQLAPAQGLSDLEMVWDVLGGTFTEADAEKVQAAAPKFRGGMKLSSTNDSGPLAASELQTGDVVLGLGRYCTRSYADLAYVADSVRDGSKEAVPVILLRDDKLRKTMLDLTPARKPRDSAEPSAPKTVDGKDSGRTAQRPGDDPDR